MRAVFAVYLMAIPETACAQQTANPPSDSSRETEPLAVFVGPPLIDTATTDSQLLVEEEEDLSVQSVLIPLPPVPRSVQAEADEEIHRAHGKAEDLLERLREIHPEVAAEIAEEAAVADPRADRLEITSPESVVESRDTRLEGVW